LSNKFTKVGVSTGTNKDLVLKTSKPMAVLAFAVDYSEDIFT